MPCTALESPPSTGGIVCPSGIIFFVQGYTPCTVTSGNVFRRRGQLNTTLKSVKDIVFLLRKKMPCGASLTDFYKVVLPSSCRREYLFQRSFFVSFCRTKRKVFFRNRSTVSVLIKGANARPLHLLFSLKGEFPKRCPLWPSETEPFHM